MGWDYCQRQGRTKGEFIRDIVFAGNPPEVFAVMPDTFNPGEDHQVIYAITEFMNEPFISVILLHHDGDVSGFKCMQDSFQPKVKNCPLQILDAVGDKTPSFYDKEQRLWALSWRNACRECAVQMPTESIILSR